MNSWLLAVIAIIIISYVFELVVSSLNIRALKPELPEEFKLIYSPEKYSKSQDYTRTTSRFSLIESSISTPVILIFILFGGFNNIDIWARGFAYGEIVTGLIFIGTLSFLSFFLSIPFSFYSTFVIEEKFGFNRTTIRTYILDILKGIALAVIIGGPLLALIQWFFLNSGTYGWVYCWIGVVAFTIIMQFLAPVLIMPLFNKFTPLENGELKEAIDRYAKKEKFQIQGIFTMDGSKRSNKLNAFFTGFGRFRKIVFFDTLLEKLSVDEIISVLAHEMGHFKRKHIVKLMIGSILQTGIMFYLLSLILSVEEISEAFGMISTSVYSSLLFFGFLYTPVSMLVSLFFNHFSRKHEFEADYYAAQSTKQSKHLVTSLKKLSQANLSNLTPHPMYVFLHYSHPPLLSRIEKLAEYETCSKI